MNVICTTTINAPTEAIELFDAMPDWTLVVAGDKKTPADFNLERGIYLTPTMQEKMDFPLSEAIGWNCIQRRNFSFLYAVKELGAEIVATVDDDNVPMSRWGDNLMIGRETTVAVHECDSEVFDPVGFHYPNLWHRGFPLSLVSSRSYVQHAMESVTPDIQSDLWNGDPDVDAICRIPDSYSCTFEPSLFPMASRKPSPFNSQNTFLSAKVMPHYFMHVDVGRFDDIVASYHVQSLGFNVVYGAPSVTQKRNAHDLMTDFNNEIWGYQNTLPMIRDMEKDPHRINNYLSVRGLAAFRLYQKHFE